ncbi:MAG: aldo/keto reductase [Woeseiaceae bacterium]|nr:aldo/keto reductase [Woeseiaceae bacterium]
MERRDFLKLAGAAGLASLAPPVLAETIAARTIPGTSERLPVIGLGNSNAFRRGDVEASMAVIERLMQFGGRYIDCGGDARFVAAEAASRLEFDNVLLGAYFDLSSPDVVRDEVARLAGEDGSMTLMNCFTDQVNEHWDVMRGFKEDGLTKFIGTARHTSEYYDTMIGLMKTGTLDVLQVNYSMLEPEAAERVLPTALDEGVAVMINRPFINGRYFGVVSGKALPEWASEFDCESWAQFSLKFILSHPAVSCVLTETENPKHAIDNLRAGLGRLPDEKTRQRMREHLLSLA